MSTDKDIAFWSMSRVIRAYKAGKIRPTDVVAAHATQRKKYNDRLRAFVSTDDQRVQKQAESNNRKLEELGHVGPLMGVPLAVKDDLAAAGWPFTRGSKVEAEDTPNASLQAPMVSSCLRGGMFVQGKTTLPEFGWKATTQSPLTGVTRNPWNPDLTPGGSSGGNAVALATGMCCASLGTDIGGSVRIPAAFCGVVGFKPTQTIMSSSVLAKTGILLHSGPMARTVEDIAMLMDVAGVGDPSRPKTIRHHSSFVSALTESIKDLKVAVSPDLGFATLDSEIRDIVCKAAECFIRIGARVDIDGPGLEDPVPTYEKMILPKLASDVAAVPENQREHLCPGLMTVAEKARDLTATDYVDALGARRSFLEKSLSVYEKYDVVVSATVPHLPFAAEREVPEGYPDHEWWHWTPTTLVYNLTGQPAISVPCGLTKSGLPVGLQIAGPHYRDDLVLLAAHAFQRETELLTYPAQAEG